MAGVVAAYRGKFPQAIASFEQSMAALNAENSLPWRLPCRLLLARAYAGLGRGGVGSAVDLARADNGLYARHAAAVAGADPQALETVSTEFENAGLPLSAADAAGRAVALYERTGTAASTIPAIRIGIARRRAQEQVGRYACRRPQGFVSLVFGLCQRQPKTTGSPDRKRPCGVEMLSRSKQ